MPSEHAVHTPALPEGRYGTRRTRLPRRWRVWLLTALGLVVASVVAYLGYVNIGSAPIEANRTTFDELPGNAMRMTFQVTRDDPDKAAVCVVRVRSLDGTETGRREVLVPPAGNGHPVSAVIRATDRPVTAEVFGCTYDVPGYMRPN